MLVKYAADNGFGVIIDTSNPWPNGPVLWAGPAVDITRPVVELYNAQSGVPAPARPAATRPARRRGQAGDHTRRQRRSHKALNRNSCSIGDT